MKNDSEQRQSIFRLYVTIYDIIVIKVIYLTISLLVLQ